jgi:hypothetical protein
VINISQKAQKGAFKRCYVSACSAVHLASMDGQRTQSAFTTTHQPRKGYTQIVTHLKILKFKLLLSLCIVLRLFLCHQEVPRGTSHAVCPDNRHYYNEEVPKQLPETSLKPANTLPKPLLQCCNVVATAQSQTTALVRAIRADSHRATYKLLLQRRGTAAGMAQLPGMCLGS